jgi:hypothetical protein
MILVLVLHYMVAAFTVVFTKMYPRTPSAVAEGYAEHDAVSRGFLCPSWESGYWGCGAPSFYDGWESGINLVLGYLMQEGLVAWVA